MISVNNISVYFGGQELFNQVSFMIHKGDRIGLVGKNGAGKSTMLKILSGDLNPNEGDISLPNNLTIGFLRQDLDFEEGRTVRSEAEQAFHEIKKIELQLSEINSQISERTDYDSDSYMNLIIQLNELNERFQLLGGYSIQGDMSQVLLGLGFKNSDFDRMTHEFSGGWRMRLELAKLLLKRPDILLLDEPTNHLDIESIIWLEEFLKKYTGAVVLVSHDRTFLDVVTNRTIDLLFGKANEYKVPYSQYVELRKERQVKQIQAKKNQDKEIKQTKDLINKFRAKKNKAAFAQTLIKKLDKLDIIEVEQDDISSMKFCFPPAPHSGKLILNLNNIFKSYEDLSVLEKVNLSVDRGEKIAFVGKNGEGKTTLAKIIVNQVDFDGKVEIGHQVKIGYYAQNQSDLLDDNKTILQTIEDVADEDSRPRVRNILGSFLFSGDATSKKIKVLSGGERARVALCKLLLDPVNLLVMDEPTNHLDMLSKDVLKKALSNYDGTLILVSHDRDFLQGLTEKVYEFKNRNIKEYLGDVNAFLEAKMVDNFKEFELRKPAEKKSFKKVSANKLSYNDRKQLDKDIRKISNKLLKLERQIDILEQDLKQLDVELTNPEKFQEMSKKEGFFKEYEKKQQKLTNFMKNWENCLEDLESKKEQRSQF